MRFPTLILASMGLTLATYSFAQTLNQELKPSPNTPTIDLPAVPQWLKTFKFENAKFTFVRIRYDSHDSTRRKFSWLTDFPDADLNFAVQVGRFTSLDVSTPSLVLRLTDPRLKDYPFIYISEPSSMVLSFEEAVALREYLNGGGFLLVDDFWGDAEWEDVKAVFQQVFPDRKPRELPLDHPIFHCLFDLSEKPQVLSYFEYFYKSNVVKREQAQFYAIEDNSGRAMVVFCHNNDLADGWERVGETDNFKREMSEARAFPMGFNILFYALMHGKTDKVAK